MPAPDWRNLPSLTALRAFDATARSGSFAEAARGLNVTHAAVAQQVRGLEDDLGVPLAQRSGRTIVLTDAGRRLAEALADGFDRIAAGVEATRRAEARRGLRIATTPAVAEDLLLSRLPEFWAECPGITVSMSPDYRSVDLAAEGFDLAVRSSTGVPDWPGVEVERLAETDIIVSGAPSLVGDPPAAPARLPWLLNLDEFDRRILALMDLDPGALDVKWTGTPTLEIAAARRGHGLIITTEIVVREDLAAGVLVRLDTPPLGRMSYHAVTLPGPRRPAVESFLEWLRRVVTD
ncbi:LysR family transcriptional regulator [Rhodobacterales bacterium HKCCE2091]|nr:LysR family transcriptional regulator [Rhodobacterales bacterium HKCCE2091]